MPPSRQAAGQQQHCRTAGPLIHNGCTVKIFRAFSNFLKGVQSEFKRVTWPTREATIRSTGVVCFVTIVVAIYLGLVDLGLSEAVKYLIR